MTKAAHYPGNTAPAPARGRSLRSGARWLVLAGACAVLLAACGGGRESVRRPAPKAPLRSWPVVEPADPAAANAVLMRALSLVGTPYRYGGNTPDSGFDCSGLVNYVYRDMLALNLPRTSRDLAGYQGPKIAPERLAAADLVFFASGGTVTHVGIYVGEGRFVHAPSSGGTVRLDHLDGPYWRDHYSGAKRVLK
ncbi:C40 family peptidase [Lysobacter silvisoli]|uniref:Peptidoglycan endopeptidase n=1 Tax=Lysobacter silvisoli TaxID=2293254 RepID=A0A371K5G5_9GAMM|nr:C40 family peptidase [Lysobacter silvisoli]RDZ29183.1 peptidoglycan endopeptidase [Lysobacter silvisoli]